MKIYDPTIVAPSKSDQYRAWLDENYPSDVLVKPADLRAFVNAPFGHRGAWFSKMVTETEPAMNVKGNPFRDRVTKRSVTQIMGGWNYTNAVNNARVRLADINDGPVFTEDGRIAPPVDSNGVVAEFIAHPRKWGVRVPHEAVVVHTKKGETVEKLYFEARVMRALEKPTYYVDGIQVDKDMLAEWLKESNSNAAHQGLTMEAEVILRDYGFEAIRQFTWAGRNIIVGDELIEMRNVA